MVSHRNLITYFNPGLSLITCLKVVLCYQKNANKQSGKIFLDDNKHYVYHHLVIKSFGCDETQKIFNREYSRKLPRDIQMRAFAKLNAIDAAVHLRDLRLPPSNRLEALKGERKGQYSIRINEQWRICFEWRNGNAEQAEIVDYH